MGSRSQIAHCNVIACLCGMAMLVAGCEWRNPAPSTERPPAATALPRLLVVANEPMADAIRREWRARTGNELPVENMTEDDWRRWVDGENALSSIADVVIYPAVYLGELAESLKILPAPDYVFGSDDGQDLLALTDILPAIRESEVQWGGQWTAIPLSSAPMLLVYRADLLEQFSLAVPRTWPELHDTAVQLNDRRVAGELTDSITGVIAQPLAAGWASRNLLARVAASIRDARKYSDVFNLTTMEPRIDSAPFVRALEQLVADQSLAADPAERLTPDEVYASVRDGRTVLGVGCWPVRKDGSTSPGTVPRLGFAPLPGSDELFDDGEGTWLERSERVQVPLLAAGGYVGSVVQGTRRQRVAWNLLKQLASPEWSVAIGSAGHAAAPFRVSHLSQVQSWLHDRLPDESLSQLQQELQAYYSAPVTMTTLRIPNATDYLDALDAAIFAALDGEKTPQEALEHAAEEWNKLLDRDDRERQADAYLRGFSIVEH